MNSEHTQLDRPLIPGTRAPLTLGQALRILSARRWLIVGVISLFASCAVAAYLFLPDSYVARVSLLIEFPGDDPVTGESYPSVLAGSYQATQVDLLKSQKVRLAVVNALNLTADPRARATFKASAPPDAAFDVWLAQRMAANIQVDTDQSSHLIGVAYEDEDPKHSAEIANALVRQYMNASKQIVADPAKSRLSHYADFLAGLRAKVDSAQDKLTAAQQKSGVIDLDQAAKIDSDRLDDLGIKLNQAESERQAAQAKVQQIQALQDSGKSVTAQAEILDSSFVQELKGRLLQLQSQRADLQQTLGTNHPRIRSLNAEIATVRSRLRNEIEAYLQSNRNQVQTATDRESALRETFDKERRRVLAQQRKRDELSKDMRELASAKQVYQAALGQYDQILGDSALPQHNISVLSWASPPLQPTGLSGRRTLLLALLMGAAVGCTLALLLELANRRIRAPEDVTRELDLPVLGDLPA